MKISVIGLGPVGETTAVGFSELNNNVIGVDIEKSRVDKINDMNKSTLNATKNLQYAISESNISFVCVGTPCKKNGEIDLSYLNNACKQIGKALKLKDKHIVVIRSTFFPGSFGKLETILERESGKVSGEDFYIAINPEFLREDYAIEDFFNPCYIVVGSDNKDIGKKVMRCYSGIDAKKFLVETDVAQMIKYANNSFHALKVAFTNELASVCNEVGIDSKKLMGLFCEDTHLNISPSYFKPGKAYGGRCLSKDLSVLQKGVKKLGITCPVIESISESNKEQIKRDKKCQ